jgi:hypothetical protein
MKYFLLILFTFLIFVNCSKIKTLSLQGRDNCIDGHAWSARPEEKRGSYYYFDARAWTWYGQGDGIGVTRSFINYNLSKLPAKANIIKATLYLYQNKKIANENNVAQHSSLSGSNECILQRIITPWTEENISWDTQPRTTSENQVIIPASTSSVQDYVIDVTQLVIDILKNRESSYGFMMRLADENYYRALVFCSTNTNDVSLYPKLEIIYKKKCKI